MLPLRLQLLIYQGDETLENSKFIKNTYVSGYTVSSDCFNKITTGANQYKSGAYNYEDKTGLTNTIVRKPKI